MTLTDEQIEDRLRRTLAAVAERELGEDAVFAAPRHRSRRVLVAASVVVAAAVGLGALVVARGGGGSDLAAAPEDANGPTLNDYRIDDDEAALLFRAEQRLTAACMDEAGQPFVEIDPGEVVDLDRYWPRIGRTDADRARRYGYEALPEDEHVSGANSALTAGMTAAERDAWSMALTGEPWEGTGASTAPRVPILDPVTGEEQGSQTAGGCFGETQRTLYGDQSRHTSLSMWIVNDLRAEVEEAVLADPALHQTIAAWRDCMADAGYQRQHPLDAVQAAVGAESDRPKAEEIAEAVADVACKDSVGLVDTYAELEHRYGQAVAAREQARLAEYRGIVAAALDRADEVLAER